MGPLVWVARVGARGALQALGNGSLRVMVVLGRIYALAPTGAEMSQHHPNHRWHNAAVVLRFKPRLVMVGASTPLSRVGHPFQSVQDAQQVKLAYAQIGATMSHQATGKLFQIAVGASRDSAFSRNFCILTCSAPHCTDHKHVNLASQTASRNKSDNRLTSWGKFVFVFYRSSA